MTAAPSITIEHACAPHGDADGIEAPRFDGRPWRVRHLEPNETLFADGEANSRLYVISAGIFLSRWETRPGVVATELLTRGDIAAVSPLALNTPHITSVLALTQGSARWINCARAQLLSERADVAFWVAQLLARRVHRAEQLLSYLNSTDALARVAWLVSELGASTGTGTIPRASKYGGLSQSVMGEAVGAKRETVNRALSHMERRGWIRFTDKAIVIVDSAALERRAKKALFLTAAPS